MLLTGHKIEVEDSISMVLAALVAVAFSLAEVSPMDPRGTGEAHVFFCVPSMKTRCLLQYGLGWGMTGLRMGRIR